MQTFSSLPPKNVPSTVHRTPLLRPQSFKHVIVLVLALASHSPLASASHLARFRVIPTVPLIEFIPDRLVLCLIFDPPYLQPRIFSTCWLPPTFPHFLASSMCGLSHHCRRHTYSFILIFARRSPSPDPYHHHIHAIPAPTLKPYHVSIISKSQNPKVSLPRGHDTYPARTPLSGSFEPHVDRRCIAFPCLSCFCSRSCSCSFFLIHLLYAISIFLEDVSSSQARLLDHSSSKRCRRKIQI
jgi:hypothetical protein